MIFAKYACHNLFSIPDIPPDEPLDGLRVLLRVQLAELGQDLVHVGGDALQVLKLLAQLGAGLVVELGKDLSGGHDLSFIRAALPSKNGYVKRKLLYFFHVFLDKKERERGKVIN